MLSLSPTHGADATGLESQGVMQQDKKHAFFTRAMLSLPPTHEADAVALESRHAAER